MRRMTMQDQHGKRPFPDQANIQRDLRQSGNADERKSFDSPNHLLTLKHRRLNINELLI